ncbi:MAG: hypothetical protein ACRECO_19690 [Xanthobacteraceae bacterium]
MSRTGLPIVCLPILCLAAFSLIAPATLAAPPESEDTRYTFHRAGDGYMRLDGRTGSVSICTRRPAGWLCQAVPDDRAALEAEIERLQGDNAALKKALLSHNLPLPGGVRQDPPPAAKPEVVRPKAPDETEINRVKVFIEKVWRRLVELIASVQREILRKT